MFMEILARIADSICALMGRPTTGERVFMDAYTRLQAINVDLRGQLEQAQDARLYRASPRQRQRADEALLRMTVPPIPAPETWDDGTPMVWHMAQTRERRATLLRVQEQRQTSTAILQWDGARRPVTQIVRSNYMLIRGNNREWYGRIGPVQSVVTDPPYGDEVHFKDKLGRKADGEIDAMPVPFDKLEIEDIVTLTKFMKDSCKGWGLIFCQIEQIREWKSMAAAWGDDRIRYNRPMIWVKPDAKPNFRGHGPGTGFETIQAYWCGGGPQSWNGGGQVGVFYHTRDRQSEGALKHPTAKPVSLMKELIRLFTNPGDTIFDPFMGCGSTGVAALELGRKFIGIEQNEEYFNEAKRRIEESVSAETLIAMDSKMPTLFGNSAYGSTNTKKRLRREAQEKEDAGQQ